MKRYDDEIATNFLSELLVENETLKRINRQMDFIFGVLNRPAIDPMADPMAEISVQDEAVNNDK